MIVAPMKKSDMYKNIRQLREIRGYTREDMADQLNMTVSGYSKIERGEVDLSISRLSRLSEILEVDMMQLLHMEVADLIQTKPNHEGSGLPMDDETFRLYGNQQKYIALLEREIERLNQTIENMRNENQLKE